MPFLTGFTRLILRETRVCYKAWKRLRGGYNVCKSRWWSVRSFLIVFCLCTKAWTRSIAVYYGKITLFCSDAGFCKKRFRGRDVKESRGKLRKIVKTKIYRKGYSRIEMFYFIWPRFCTSQCKPPQPHPGETWGIDGPKLLGICLLNKPQGGGGLANFGFVLLK